MAALTAILGSTGLVARNGSQQLPEFSQWSALCQGIEHTASIALGDLDGDGDLDLVFGNGRHFREVDWVYSNDGRGTFYGKRPLGTEPDGTYGVALGGRRWRPYAGRRCGERRRESIGCLPERREGKFRLALFVGLLPRSLRA